MLKVRHAAAAKDTAAAIKEAEILLRVNPESQYAPEALLLLAEVWLQNREYERALAYTRGITVETLRTKYKQASIPLGRSGKLSEVAGTVCFLASERAGYIHGTVVNVSGGKSRA